MPGTNTQTLTGIFGDIADEIRAKDGSSATITPANMANAIAAIPSGGGIFIPSYVKGVILEDPDATFFDMSELEQLSHYLPFTSMYSMFYNCSSLQSVDLSQYFMSGDVTDMDYVFYKCSALEYVNLYGFDTRAATTMMNMFHSCSSLLSLNLYSFDTSNVTNMSGMLYGCSSLGSIEFGPDFDTSNVTTMSGMFRNCSSLTSLDLRTFDTSGVTGTNLNNMFNTCSNLESINASAFETSNTSSAQYMFASCSSLTALIWGIDRLSVVPLKSTAATAGFTGTCPIRNGGTGYIYVRDSLVSAYKQATNWSSLANQIKSINDLPLSLQSLYNIDPQDYQ